MKKIKLILLLDCTIYWFEIFQHSRYILDKGLGFFTKTINAIIIDLHLGKAGRTGVPYKPTAGGW